MGLYLRKSVSVGPFRFNVSKGGVGVSVGVKGLRVGSGPRGNYVHMGRQGIYYRATVPASGAADLPRPARRSPNRLPSIDPVIPAGTHGPMVDIDSASATTIVDSSSKTLLDELNAKHRRGRRWPWAAAASGFLLWLCLMNGMSGWGFLCLFLLSVVFTAAVHVRDMLQKAVVLLYEFEPDIQPVLEDFHRSMESLMSVGAIWHVSSHAQVYDAKYHAGADTLVARSATRFLRLPPPGVKTNIQTIAVNVGTQTLHFFPDRVLIYDKHGVGAVGYQELHVDVDPTSFVENGVVPRDATVIGSTWRYVNKKGGPDRRFKDNREIPICRYDELRFRSETGMNEVLHVSRSGAGVAFAEALRRMAMSMPAERRA
jgi:Protein of unknown function (DUF4236)